MKVASHGVKLKCRKKKEPSRRSTGIQQSHDPPRGVCRPSTAETRILPRQEDYKEPDQSPARPPAPALRGRGGGQGSVAGGYDEEEGYGAREGKERSRGPGGRVGDAIVSRRLPDDVTRARGRYDDRREVTEGDLLRDNRDTSARPATTRRSFEFDDETRAHRTRGVERDRYENVRRARDVIEADISARPRAVHTYGDLNRRSRSPAGGDQAERPKRKPAQPDRFDGTSSVEAFLEQFDTCATYNRWSEEDRYVQLKLSLRGSAAGLLMDCCDVKTYQEFQAKLRQRFDAKGREVSFRAQLRSRRRQRGETLQELYISIGDLMHQAYPRTGSVHRAIAACDAFIDCWPEI